MIIRFNNKHKLVNIFMDYTLIIQNWILSNLDTISFIKFSQFCGDYRNKPAHSFADLKANNTKVTGDLFEYFCKLYLQHVIKLEQVWIYHEIPPEIKKLLNLSKKDMGIDIIGIKDNKYYAIQCKYRKRNKSTTMITWKDLSTFYALVSRSGPYYKIIVMTNADYVKRIGVNQDNEMIIGFNQLKTLAFEEWFNMCQTYSYSHSHKMSQQLGGNSISSLQVDSDKQKNEQEYVRQKRNEFLDSLVTK